MRTTGWTACGLVFGLLLGVAATPTRATAGEPTTGAKTAAGDAARGRQTYEEACAMCHGTNLEGGGGPTLKGADFQGRWLANPSSLEGLTATLHTMPMQAPGSLTAQQYADLFAYLISANGH